MPEEIDFSAEFENDEARAAWLTSLPESAREWQEATTATSPAAFYDQVGDLRSQLGRSLVIPTEEASDEQRAAFYEKVMQAANGRLAVIPGEDDEVGQAAWRKQQGIPDAPEAYEFPELDEGLPQDILSPERAEALRALAHKHGVPAAQFKALAGDLLTLDAQAIAQAQAAQKAAQDELREAWPEDAYDQRYQRVAAFLERDGAPPELIQAAHAKNLGPKTAQYLYSVSQRMAGEAGEVSRQTGGATVDAAEDAQQRIDEIMAQDGRDGKPKHPYWDQTHPEHQKALQRMVALQKRANPSAEDAIPGRAPLPSALTG